MIEVELKHRLGNWLFQYAAGRVLAIRTGTNLVLDVHTRASWRDPYAHGARSLLRFFSLRAECSALGPTRRRVLEGLRMRDHVPDFTERAWGYDPRFEKLSAPARLRGFFQSPRYWTGLEEAIRADLQPRRVPRAPGLTTLLSRIESVNAVAVHVRRSDYLVSRLHDVCAPEYFDSAMAYLRATTESPTFFLFSDDPRWCRARYGGGDVVHVADLLERDPPTHHLYAMSRCRHHVIANSTFSWWGAWLNARQDKIVVAPDRWFTDEAMDRLAMRDTVPAEWVRMPADGGAHASTVKAPARQFA